MHIPEQQSLSQDNLEHYRDDGFFFVDDVFSMQEIEVLRAICASPLILQASSEEERAHQTLHHLGIVARHPALLDLARDERIISHIRPLIGPDIELQHSKLAAKATTVGKGPFQWHQDFAFFPHTNTDLVAVMVMLDDATPENGAMSMVKGSHKLGLLEHRKDGNFTGGCQENHIWEDAPENVISITPKAGGISVHHCLTLHGSPPNLSGRPRRGIVFQYRASDAYQLADEVWEDTGLLVAGQYREQVRCTVGTVWLPRVPTRQPRYGSAWHQQGSFAQATNAAE